MFWHSPFKYADGYTGPEIWHSMSDDSKFASD